LGVAGTVVHPDSSSVLLQIDIMEVINNQTTVLQGLHYGEACERW
jgi:hypothetical protein